MRTRALAIVVLALLPALAADAQTDDRLRTQLRQVTIQLRQAQDDQAAAQAQKIAAEMERDQLKRQLAVAQAELARARHSGDRVGVVEGELAKVKADLGQAADAAQKDKVERERMQADVLATASMLGACQAKNAKLLAIANQILREYENFDMLDAVGANEPFTKLKRVELENLAQDYQDRIDDSMFDTKAAAQPAPPRK
jgi:hypothetical protein